MSLPKGFKRLEFIQSSGTQYVDSGFKPNQDTRIEAVAEYINPTESNPAIFGARNSSSQQFWAFWSGTDFYARYDTEQTPISATLLEKHVFSLNKNVFSVDEMQATLPGAIFQSNYTAFLFSVNAAGTANYFASAKLYSCQIYDNGALVRDYIPCQNASGAVGLWDNVHSVFYGNAGSGTFAAGHVVSESVDEIEIKELKYIQSNGSQYVDTKFVPDHNTRVLLDGYNDSASSGWTYGTWESAALNQFAGSCNKSYAVRYGTTSATLSENVPVGPVHFDQNKNAYNVKGITGLFPEQIFTCKHSIYLFAINAAGAVSSGKFSGKIYSCQIYNNGFLDRDFVPAMLSNGEVGLYEQVYHEFYRNAGTGEFIAGPEAQTGPKAPANFRVMSESDTLVTLAWDASEDVLGYRLYRAGQLLADTTETSISVAVEPFAGAVFTLTAYNENGEGEGATLTYYSIQKNPLLYLITDRTQQDVVERNPKGYYAASDLNRVGYAMIYVAERVLEQGAEINVTPKTDWTDADWMSLGDAAVYLKYLSEIRSSVSVLSNTPNVPDDLTGFTFEEANNIELILQDIDRMLTFVYTNLLYAGEVFAGEV